MIHNYFKPKKNQYKLLKFLITKPSSNKVDLKIKKKISNLNEYQYFSLFSDFIFTKTINLMTIEELEHFFNFEETIHYQDNYLPFSDIDTEELFKEIDIVFNCKNELENLVEYHLNTKEYPKQTIITKLNFIRENIINAFLNDLSISKSLISAFLKRNDLIKEYDAKTDFVKMILIEITKFEKKLLSLENQINDTINNFSTKRKGNYLINVKDEIIEKLYIGLKKYDFIDIDKTSQKQFLEVLKLDWTKHKSIIYLKLDNIQFNYFIKCCEKYLNIKIALTNLEDAKNIKTKNGSINAKSMYSSKSRSNTTPKENDYINSIFEEIKKG